MLQGVEVITHSAIKLNKSEKIYIDPYNIEKYSNDADFVFITHSHFDHFSIADIKKVMSKDTIYIIPSDCKSPMISAGFDSGDIVVIKPGLKYNVNGLNFSTIPAYNLKTDFHPKKNNWVRIFNIYRQLFLLYSRRYRQYKRSPKS